MRGKRSDSRAPAQYASGEYRRRVMGKAGEHVGEPGARIDIVELGGLNQRIDGGAARWFTDVPDHRLPNWNGTIQKRVVAVSGDRLKYITPATSIGGRPQAF
jgi:hypothetical protein